MYLQKQGVCIGSIAPILSDWLLANCDRLLDSRLPKGEVIRVFRYVDDYLVMFKTGNSVEESTKCILQMFQDCLSPLSLTHEVPVERSIRFLDLRLLFRDSHVCWWYEPCGNEALLSYESCHSKLVKRGIVNTCLSNVIKNLARMRCQTASVFRPPVFCLQVIPRF